MNASQPQSPAPELVPPHDVDAEARVLCEMLASAPACLEVRDVLAAASDFYVPKHARIYEAICSLSDEDERVDDVTVLDRLRRLGAAEGITRGDLAAMWGDGLADPADARTHASIVAELAAKRRGAAVASAAFRAYLDPTKDAQAATEQTMAALLEVEPETQGAKVVAPLAEAVGRVIERAHTLASQGGSPLVGLPTGFADLDTILGGLRPGSLTILGARPSMGKTAFALGVAAYNALRDTPTLFVSAEMAAEEIGQRVAAVVGEVPLEGLRNGRLDERGWGRLDRAHRVLGNVPLDLMDRAAPTAGEVRMRAKAVQARKGLGLLVVDYLQLLQHDRAERHELAVGQAAWAFKTLARDLQCPVILLSQLNRGCEARSDKRPMLSDLRDSGQLEQHADVVLFLYRDEVYNPQSPDAGTAEVLVAKNRSGPTSTCKLAFLGTQARFASLDTHHSEPRF